jgi:hypothetical protein
LGELEALVVVLRQGRAVAVAGELAGGGLEVGLGVGDLAG